MSLHKLTAGDGYTYLTRQVAVGDATDRGASGLADYYSEKGESPGRWWGGGLDGVDLSVGAEVTEAQMKSLFGEGRHPDAAARRTELVRDGASKAAAEAGTRLGQPFRIAAGETEFAKRVARAYAEHNQSIGAKWSDPIDSSTRSRMRSKVAEEMFVERYGRRPLDARERHGFVAEESRHRTSSVAGFDLSFTPVKSVSALWAIADLKTAREIERAHAAAVQDTLAWLEANVLFTRLGHHGVRQVPTRGLIAAAFTHRDSRAGDPNIHTHVAVSNKVQDGSGRWLAIDARVLFKANVTLSEHYNTRLEAELGARLSLAFSDESSPRERGRPVREVVGVDPRLGREWSQRRRVIDGRRAELAHQFQAAHGRPPTPTELIALSQQANLETREAKHERRAERTQREAWADEARQVLGSRDAVATMVRRCLSPTRSRRLASPPTAEWIAAAAGRVVRTVEADRATWQTWHIRAEAQRQVRYAGLPLDRSGEVIDAVVACATEQDSVALGDPDPANHPDLVTPAALRREDGSSVYTVHGSRRFTSQRILDAENAILVAAARCDGRVVSAGRVRGLKTRQGLQKVTMELSDEQVRLVARLAGSSPRVQVALAPAGSGKTTCMRALADLWISEGGQVVGLAPSAAAAHQLRDSLSDGQSRAITCDTLSKLAWDLENSFSARWAGLIDETTMVIIDEAAMAGTLELAAAITHITERGGTVRLIGDDRQLASVAAGGVVRAVADQFGAATLTETRRFADPVEGAATLALRDGDPIALGYYADHDRLHVGDNNTTADQAYAAWRSDLADGLTSVLIAPTRELVSDLNARAQRDSPARRQDARSRMVALPDGTSVGPGDIVITRRNDRRLTTTATDWVKNGDRWIVTDLNPDDSLRLQHVEDARHQVTVPSEYVAHHLSLGYAITIHGAQGLTVDTAHAVLTGAEDRSLVYVAMTRGRMSNHVYVDVTPAPASGTSGPAWHDLATRPETLAPPTAVEILTSALARAPQAESATASATETSLTTAKTLELLRAAADRYRDSLYVAAEGYLGSETLRRLTDVVTTRLPELTDEPGWDALRGHLLLTALHTGQDPVDLLSAAIDRYSLAGAHDAAAVLAARLTSDQPASTGPPSPIPWLQPIPRALAEDSTWRRYLDERLAWVVELAARAAQSTDAWQSLTDSDVPTWARPLLNSADSALVGDLALWRAVEDIEPTDLAPAGLRRRPGIARQHQATLEDRVSRVLIAHDNQDVNLPDAVLVDPWLPQLQLRLGELGHVRGDVARAIEASLEQPLPTEVPAAALWWRTQRHHVERPDASATDAHLAPIDPGPDPRWEVESGTGYQRIVELHQLALDYYGLQYDRSWAPQFLTDRLYNGWEGDLSNLRCGYAPPGPESLIRHLSRHGATAQELIEAGLARRRESAGGGSSLVDTFRDRVVFPLYDPRNPSNVVGFVGRRNPTKGEAEYAGPKYLNTRTTAAYAKSDNLFGLEMLSSYPHARPVLVEGPLDAIAVTLATSGHAVGIAPLGTALTDAQVRIVTESTSDSPLVMFDGDEPGAAAAKAASSTFAESDVAAQIVHLPAGLDPCQTLHERGAAALAGTVDQAWWDDSVRKVQVIALTQSSVDNGRRTTLVEQPERRDR